MKRYILITLLALMLSACAVDPRRDADAYATRQQADAQAQAMDQSLKQQAETHALWMARVNVVSKGISTLMTVTMIALMFFAIVAIASSGIGVSFLTISAGIATAQRNLSQPIQIRLDPVTRQFPLLITKIKDGAYSLSNPNTDSITMLYERNPADMMMIQAMSATQHDGALAYQARMSHKPGEISAIESPQIIEMERAS
jgi:ABC-type multidrug transport system fused ATPase/permease subunit